MNEAVDFVIAASTPVMRYEQADLEMIEPEKDHSVLGSKSKILVKILLFVAIFFYIIMDSFRKLGTEKIQVMETEMHNEYHYNLTEMPL